MPSTTTTTTLLPPPTPSLLTPIDITSSGPHSKFWLRCLQRGRHWGNLPSPPSRPSPPSPRLLLTLRILIFHYMLISLLLLLLHQAHRRHPIPILLHFLQLFTSLVSLLTVPTRPPTRISSVLPSSAKPRLAGWWWPRRSRVVRPFGGLARSIGWGFRRLTRLLIRACALAALVSDVVFWSGNSRLAGLDELLLYTCNLIPVAFEAVAAAWAGVLGEMEGMVIVGGVLMIASLMVGRAWTPRGLICTAVVYSGTCLTLFGIRRSHRWWTRRTKA